MRKLKTYELDRLSVENFKKAEKHPVYLILDNIRSAHNVGSIFRTADAFRIAGIYLCGITPQPPHREIHKTALGAMKTVDWHYEKRTIDIIQQFQEKEVPVVGVEQTDASVSLQKFKPAADQPLALVFGNEVDGISQSVVDRLATCVEIPQYGTKHSFNISVSVGIVLWETLKKIGMMER